MRSRNCSWKASPARPCTRTSLQECEVPRFEEAQTADRHASDRSQQDFAESYDILHPFRPRFPAGPEGQAVPRQAAEACKARTNGALFNLIALIRPDISGPGALRLPPTLDTSAAGSSATEGLLLYDQIIEDLARDLAAEPVGMPVGVPAQDHLGPQSATPAASRLFQTTPGDSTQLHTPQQGRDGRNFPRRRPCRAKDARKGTPGGASARSNCTLYRARDDI